MGKSTSGYLILLPDNFMWCIVVFKLIKIVHNHSPLRILYTFILFLLYLYIYLSYIHFLYSKVRSVSNILSCKIYALHLIMLIEPLCIFLRLMFEKAYRGFILCNCCFYFLGSAIDP